SVTRFPSRLAKSGFLGRCPLLRPPCRAPNSSQLNAPRRKPGFGRQLWRCTHDLPPLVRPVRYLHQRRWYRRLPFAVAAADLLDDFVELSEGLKPPQTFFEILGDAQFRSVPGGELAEQHAAVFAVLLRHQRKMADEEGNQFLPRRLGGSLALPGDSQLAEDPWVHHRAAADRDRVTPGDVAHPQGIFNSSHVAVADD